MIELKNITLSRGATTLIQSADARIHDGWRIGLTGRNGSGKSTLLALLRGEIEPDQGDCLIPSNWKIAGVRQETPALNQSALEYTLMGDLPYQNALQTIAQAEKTGDGLTIARAHEQMTACNGYARPAQAAELLAGLGFPLEKHHNPVKSFSGGWRMRLNLAQALIAPADLLLDEPTNHLDLDAIIWLQDFLKNHRATQIIIAHDREFLDELCQHILHIERKSLTTYPGNYSQFERTRHARLEQSRAAYTKESEKRAHLQNYIDRFRAKASKARQAQSRLKALEKLNAAPPPPPENHYRLTFPNPERSPSPLVQIEKAAIAYQDRTILKNLTLKIASDARIGLLGKNGAGKTTLMKLIAGKLNPSEGSYTAHQHTRIAHFTQHALETLDPESTPYHHYQQTLPNAPEQTIRDQLGGYGFQGDDIFTPIKHLSGGEKARLALALLINQRPNLLLLDEPTNHLDLPMRDALTTALQAYNGAVILISHDRNLLRTTADEFLLIENKQLIPFDGSLEDYRNHLNQPTPQQTPATPNERKQQRRDNAEQRRQQKPLKDALKKAEKTLTDLQTKAAQIEAELTDTTLYQDQRKQDLQKILQAQTENKRKLEKAENDWLEAADALEQALEGASNQP